MAKTTLRSRSQVPETKAETKLENSSKNSETTAERDAKALERMEERFGGRDTGIFHLEDGKPVSVASHVRKNFFRYVLVA